nr:anthranilate n-methyltransferase [Quercus suber]POE55745.1 anthranilate n-methyltransferase [Quercus suber]
MLCRGYFMNDWSDDRCLKLLENCYNSLPNDGKVIVVEQILPIYPEISTFARSKFLLDMLLMTQKPGGKERKQHEFDPLAFGSGFMSFALPCYFCNSHVMEFYKKGVKSVSVVV